MQGSAHPEGASASTAASQTLPLGRNLAETELDSALQLLMERTQYITGATGAALALPQGEEMVCRASAGSSAPAVGARLQVRSGLTGESISRRQLLRCDNAETDPRVNLETCRALGIASIVVLPLLRRSGEVRGLFELFSDHPYAFEERDLVALERMADLTSTALDLAEKRPDSPSAITAASSPSATDDVHRPVEFLKPPNAETAVPVPVSSDAVVPLSTPATQPPASPSPPSTGSVQSPPLPAAVPEAMLRVQKCASCGFPVSEGRSLCLDCEKKNEEQKDNENKGFEKKRLQQLHTSKPDNLADGSPSGPKNDSDQPQSAPPAAVTPEFVPAFLANATPATGSWLSNHVNLLAVVVLVLGVLVAVVVFR